MYDSKWSHKILEEAMPQLDILCHHLAKSFFGHGSITAIESNLGQVCIHMLLLLLLLLLHFFEFCEWNPRFFSVYQFYFAFLMVLRL